VRSEKSKVKSEEAELTTGLLEAEVTGVSAGPGVVSVVAALAEGTFFLLPFFLPVCCFFYKL
jgi:hypothetical protein